LEIDRDLEGLILANARLIASLAHRYKGESDFAEMFSEIVYLIATGFDKYDETRGRFYHFCYWCAKSATGRVIRNSRTITEPGPKPLSTPARLAKVGEHEIDRELRQGVDYLEHDKISISKFLIYIEDLKQRTAVQMVMLERRTLKQAGEAMKLSPERVRQLKNSGIKALRYALWEEGYTMEDFR
jgi:RNA polymerase sigma factor (sigma-70 family)